MGRTTWSGPTVGGYDTWIFNFDDVANSETITYTMVVPYALKIMEITMDAQSIGSDPQYTVINDSTDVIADRALSATAETITPTSTPALLDRTMAKGDVLTVSVIADSGDTAEGVCIAVTVHNQGHVVAAEADD